MTSNGKDTVGECLNLQSRLSELTRVHEWIERLATAHSIPASTLFAMNLCLEEALSNIIRHGYSGKPDRSITIQLSSTRENYFVFVIEDEATAFNPVASPELPAFNASDDIRIGGQGIRLLRKFADELDYQATPTGNRLSVGFSAAGSAIAKD